MFYRMFSGDSLILEGDMRKLRFVVTDIDGTILDRMPIYTRAFVDLLVPFGLDAQAAKTYYLDSAGLPIDTQFREAIALVGRSIEQTELTNIVRRFFVAAGREKVKPFPQARAVLHALKAAELVLCATSGSNTEELKQVFAAEDLPYDMVLGSDEVKKGEAHIRLFAENFGVSFEDFCVGAIFLGDGPTDMAIAGRCRICACGITTTVDQGKLLTAGADHIVASLDEFLALVRSQP